MLMSGVSFRDVRGEWSEQTVPQPRRVGGGTGWRLAQAAGRGVSHGGLPAGHLTLSQAKLTVTASSLLSAHTWTGWPQVGQVFSMLMTARPTGGPSARPCGRTSG